MVYNLNWQKDRENNSRIAAAQKNTCWSSSVMLVIFSCLDFCSFVSFLAKEFHAWTISPSGIECYPAGRIFALTVLLLDSYDS